VLGLGTPHVNVSPAESHCYSTNGATGAINELLQIAVTVGITPLG